MRKHVADTAHRAWVRAVRLVLGRHVDVSGDPAVAVRDLFFRFAVVISIFTLPMLLGSEAPEGWRFAGGAAIATLVLAWLHGRRRGRFPFWLLTLEGTALGVFGVAVGNPLSTTGVLYSALWFRAFYGTRRSAAALGLTYVGAYLVAVALANQLGFAPATSKLLSPGVVMQIPGVVLTVAIIRVLVAVNERRNEAARRHGVFADVGTALAAAEDIGDVAAAALDGAVSIAGADGAVPAAIAFMLEQDLVVAAATDPDLVGMTLPTGGLDHGEDVGRPGEPGNLILQDGAAPVSWESTSDVPVMVDGDLAGAIIVGAAGPDLHAALAPLAAHVGLALARVESMREIQAREARFRSLVANANDVIRVVDRNGIILYESDPVRHVLGYDPAELIGTNGFDLLHPDDVDIYPLFEQMLTQPGVATPPVEVRMRHADGSWREIEGTGRNLLDDPAVRGLVVNYRDVTDRKRLEAELQHRALHDPLTELPNRALFEDRVEHALRSQGRHAGQTLGILFIDLDDFKVINDGLGHRVGDAALVATAQRLEAAARAADTCARLGGDEFGILLEALASPDEAYAVSTRILDALRKPVTFEGTSVDINASVGIAVSVGNETADELIRNADLAMHRAKSAGKGTSEVFEAGMHAAVRDRLALKADIERGVAHGEFVPFYQPIVNLATERTVAVEALVRWEHPVLGVLPPAAFLGLAEETGLIVPIGRQVIAQACRDAATWKPALTLNVNLSVPELQRPDLPAFLATTLADSRMEPQRMIIEITESIMVADAAAASCTLGALKTLGVRVALDDFGTGYSSLAFLGQFPVDVVKIDKTFIDSLGTGSSESPLASAILTLGRSLGVDVCAEGVEGPIQLRRLRELGCVEGQGYYFSRPVSASDLEKYLGRHRSPVAV